MRIDLIDLKKIVGGTYASREYCLVLACVVFFFFYSGSFLLFFILCHCHTAVSLKGTTALMRRSRPLVPAFTTSVSLSLPFVLKHTLDSHRWAPGEGLEPSSPEGHQLACHSVCVYTITFTHMISRLTPFRAYSDLPSLGTPALLICEQVLQFMPLSLW